MKFDMKRNLRLNNGTGITLIVLIVTIIVLLIFVGVSSLIINSQIIDKAIETSTKNAEALVDEAINMAYIECNTEYLERKTKQPNLDKKDFFFNNFKNYLSHLENVNNIELDFDSNDNLNISINYKNQEYKYSLSIDGTVNKNFQLIGNVKIGDYINYPIEYTDIFSNTFYKSNFGWRVIDNGKESGKVKIISTGIPAKWGWKGDINSAVQDLIYNFEELSIRDASSEVISGDYFKVDGISQNISILSLKDFNELCNKIYGCSRTENDVSDFSENCELFALNNIDSYYWLATNSEEEANKLYCVYNGIKITSMNGMRLGLRPVIELNDELKGSFNNSVWQIIN